MQDLFVQGGTDMENKQEVQAVIDAINNVILGKQEQVQEASGKEASASSMPRDLPKVADKMEDAGPEFDIDMDL